MKKHLLTKTFLFLTFLIWTNVGWGQTSVNFDTPANWTLAGAASSYLSHAYSESGAVFQGTEVIQNPTTVQDGFAGALGTYSFRLRNTAATGLNITIATGGVGNFSFKVRRWDASPLPDYTVKYSINGGVDWVDLTHIDGTLLTTSDWFTYSGTINKSNNAIQIKINNTGTTERIMVDDFSWFGYVDVIAPVATFDPLDGAIDVLITKDITVTFDEAIRDIATDANFDNTTVDALITSFETVVGATPVAFDATIDATNQIITIAPTADLAGNTEYTLTLAAVEDASNNATTAKTISFTTIDPTAPVISDVAITEVAPYYAGDDITVTWTSANVDFVKIEAWVPSISAWEEMLASTDATDGSEVITIPANAYYSTAYKVRVSYVTTPAVNAESSAFTIIATPTINDIQSNTSDGDASVFKDQIVKTSGIVTAIDGGNYFIQDGDGQWKGIQVMDGTNTPAIGDSITLQGTVQENFTLTRLNTITSYLKNSSSNPLPTVAVITASQLIENYEGVFVKLYNTTIEKDTLYGMFIINDASGRLVVDDDMFAYTTSIGNQITITGIGHYSFNDFKILPRSATDIVSASDTVTSSVYTVNNTTNIISNIPYTISVATVKANITACDSATYNIYNADGTTPATVIDDTKKVIVVAADGLTSRIYTLAFIAPSDDATLSDLKIDGTTVSGFVSNTYDYILDLPFGTSVTPVVTVAETDANASSVIIDATDITSANAVDRTTTVTVTAEDGVTTQDYTVLFNVTPALTGKSILTYSFAEQTGPATIGDGTIEVEVTNLTDRSNLIATFTISDEASIAIAATPQVSGTTPNDFTSPVTYVVTAQDASTKDWVVTVTNAATLSTANDFLTFSVLGVNANVNSTNHTVTAVLPYGTDRTALVATFIHSTGATVKVGATAQVSGTTPNDFTNAVVYTITAEDGTTVQDWTVTITNEAPSADASLSDLKVDGTTIPGFASATLAYTYELPFGTTATPAVTVITTEAHAVPVITPATDVTSATEANRTTTIDVTAQDGATLKNYTVLFNIIPGSTDATLSDLTVNGITVTGFASGTFTYNVTLPFGTVDVPNVAGVANHADATAVPTQATNVTGTLAERTASVLVTAQDGTSTETYYVVFSVAAETGNLIISEYIEGGTGTNKAIELFNPNTTSVDLSQYIVKQSYNGEGWGIRGAIADSRYVFQLTGTLAAGEVYVITASDVNALAEIKAASDTALAYNNAPNGSNGTNVPFHNGNDAIGLFKNGVLIDVVGIELVANGAGPWTVAGTAGASESHTLLRKYGISTGNINWTASAGTDASNSEWIVEADMYVGNIGLPTPLVNTAPEITAVTLNPTNPTTNQAVVVSATITDNSVAAVDLTVALLWGTAAGSETNSVTFAQVGFTNEFTGTIPAAAVGTIYYKITASDGEMSSESTGSYNVIATGINDPTSFVKMNIYPNPNNGQFNIELSAQKAGKFDIEIVNVLGQVVYQKQINQDGTYKDQIDISDSAKGLYYIRINDGTSTKVHKLMIQ